MSSENKFTPIHDPSYVPFGFYSKLQKIVKSKTFYPVYITGLSGNGKTIMVEQVCAALSRELIRVNITKRTDESDLIGTYELINGNTLRKEGPVITAMRRGAVLLLDETDLGTEDLLCLQPILEGKPYFDKKTGEVVHPEKGFNIIATANTKGKGNDDGRFIGANILNEAFLERFAITIEQEYPEAEIEKEILRKKFKELDIVDDQFVTNLVNWTNVIRKSYFDGAVDEIVSTRRLVHIAQAYSMFQDKMESLELCLNRFDEDTKVAFIDLYTKIDSGIIDENEMNLVECHENLAGKLSGFYNTKVRILMNSAVDDRIIVESHNGTRTEIPKSVFETVQNLDQYIMGIVETHSKK